MILHRPCSGAAPNRRAAFIGTNAVMRPGLRCRGAFSRSERVRDLPRDHQRQDRARPAPGGRQKCYDCIFGAEDIGRERCAFFGLASASVLAIIAVSLMVPDLRAHAAEFRRYAYGAS
jgi:hypothetical protein